MVIRNTGNVGIGTTNPGQNLTVAGSVGLPGIANGAGTAYICTTLATGVLSTSTTACNPSSLRFKDNVQDLEYGLDDVLKLKPVSFTYKPKLKVPGNQVGFIAEEVVQVVPEVVGLDAEGRPNNVDYAKIVPLLVNAIKELAAKLTDLASTVANFAQSFTTKELIATNITADTGTFRTLHSDTLNTDELCVSDVCITRDQFLSMVAAANAAPASPSVGSPANDNDPPADAEPPADEPADPINATASSTPPVATDAETSSPANDNDASTTLPATEPTSAAQ